MSNKTNSGVLEFSDDQKVFVSVEEDDTVKKAVLIDREGNETPLAELTPGALALYAKWSEIAETDKKIKLIGGAIRNAGEGWAFIDDENHRPLNLESVEVYTSGNYKILNLVYGFTAKKIISLAVVPDETFAGVYDIGGSVGLSNTLLTIKKLAQSYGGMVILDQGAINKTYSNFTNATFNNSTGEIRLYHESLTGISGTEIFTVTAITNNADYTPILGSMGTDFVSLLLVNNTTGAILKDIAEISDLRLSVNRTVNAHIANADEVVNDSGNFWIFGVMEVDDESEE